MAETPQDDDAAEPADDPADRGEDSRLELSSLSIFRRRKKGTAADASEDPAESADPAREPVPASESSRR